MKSMATLGQAPAGFSISKDAQANHAFQLSVITLLHRLCFVDEYRNRGNGLGIQPFGGGIGNGGVLKIEAAEMVKAGGTDNVGDGDGGWATPAAAAAGLGLGMSVG